MEILFYVENFLSNRKLHVKINNKLSDEKCIENGVPQGENLSVVLFLLAMNKLLEYLPKIGIEAGLFADDLVIYCRGKNIKSLKKLLERTLSNLELWSQSTGFRFSSEKTKAIHFTKLHYNRHNPRLQFCGKTISYVDNIKFLGLVLDNKLNWKEHIRRLKMDCNQRLNILKVLGHHKWGSHRESLLRIYQALIKSRIDYGCIFYGLAKRTVLKQIDPIQNTAIRLATGAYRTSPTESLEIESSQMPLHYRRRLLTLNYLSNLATNPSVPAFDQIFLKLNNTMCVKNHSPIHSYIRSSLSDLNITLPDIEHNSYNAFPPWTLEQPLSDFTLCKYVKSDTSPEQYRQVYLETLLKYNNFIKISTDGSKFNNQTGAAFVTEGDVFKFRLPDVSSVFTAEAYSLLKVSKFIQENNTSNQFLVQSDSLSALTSLQQQYSSNKVIQQTQDNFHQAITSGKIVVLLWVPAHVGIKDNERADQAAKDATKLTEIQSIITAYDFKSYLKCKVKESWEKSWENKYQNKLRQIKSTVNPWHTGRNRREQVIITRLRIGHTRLTHSYLMQRNEPPFCEQCNKPITVKHLIVECSKYEASRRLHKIPNKIEEALSNNDESVLNVLKYLKDVNLFTEI